MRFTTLLALLALLLTTLPLSASASGCGQSPPGYYRCEVVAGPLTASAYADVRTTDIAFGHCLEGLDERVERIVCQDYRVA